jgi:hypothetical protein
VKVGVQKLKGQKKTEMKYCSQLWSVFEPSLGIWGVAVLTRTPIRRYIAMRRPVQLKRVLKKFTPTHILPVELVISAA